MEIMFQFTLLLIMTHKRGQPVTNWKCFFHLNAFSKDMKGHDSFVLLYWLKRDRRWVCVTDKLTENSLNTRFHTHKATPTYTPPAQERRLAQDYRFSTFSFF